MADVYRHQKPKKPGKQHFENRSQLVEELDKTKKELYRLKYGAINAHFVQVSKQYIDEITELARRAPAAHKTLWSLIKQMDKQNAVMISQESLVKVTGYSKPTVQRALATLKAEKWLAILKVGTANVYKVNSTVVWQSRANEKWASFSAQVIVNFEEQDEETKNGDGKTRHIPMVDAQDDVLVLQDGDVPPPDQPQLDFYASDSPDGRRT
jgi:hypothetical protein